MMSVQPFPAEELTETSKGLEEILLDGAVNESAIVGFFCCCFFSHDCLTGSQVFITDL